jgi:ribosomal protein S10
MKIIRMPSQRKEFEHFQVEIEKRRMKIWQDTRKAERNFLYYFLLLSLGLQSITKV